MSKYARLDIYDESGRLTEDYLRVNIFEHKGYVKGITVSTSKTNNIIPLLNTKIAKSKECTEHLLYYSAFNEPYRLYRRGKNRCKKCGLKIKEVLTWVK
jgi:hypothetical protein